MSKVIPLLICLLSLNLYAKKPVTGQEIFSKKCEMCHDIYGPQTFQEQKDMVAPTITLAMKSVTIGTDAIEEPKTKAELKKLTIEFLKDYILHPHKDKAYCEETVFKRFNTMPSLKGFITQEQLDIVLPYVYDNFAPKDRDEF